MAQTEATVTIALNGVTAVDALTGPSSGRYVIGSITIVNTDTGAISPIAQIDESGTPTQLSGSGDTYQVGQTFIAGQGLVLDANTKKLQLKLAAAITSVNPRAIVNYLIYT